MFNPKLYFVCEEENFDTKLLEDSLYGIIKSNINLSAELIFCSEEEIQNLNKTTRNIDSVTDVLSYPTLNNIKSVNFDKKNFKFDIDENGNLFIGSIAICLKRAKEQAAEYNHSEKREIYYLTVHGILHLLGYDHMTEEDKTQMRALEEQILTKMDIKRDN